jgi:hypothetical protein
MSLRPTRTRISDELSRQKSLPTGPDHFESFGNGDRVLVVGLGPDPSVPAKLLAGKEVYYVESLDFATQMEPAWFEAVPKDWVRLEPGAVDVSKLADMGFLTYRPAAKLFPGFYGPVLARCRLAAMSGPWLAETDTVWLPLRRRGLLGIEIEEAFTALGLNVRSLEAERARQEVPKRLAKSTPGLYFSINFSGLDPHGEIFELLTEAGASVAIWCVDNPFHLLSGLKSAFWRKAVLFVTDASFIPLLKQHGAKHVHHLPLATSKRLFGEATPRPQLSLGGRMVFVGRSSFPDKDHFFAGCETPDEAVDDAMGMLGSRSRPDYAWWRVRLGARELWPGPSAREVGCGAEESSQSWRVRCLAAAKQVPLTVFGDGAWRHLVPGLGDLRPEVDYYGPLAGIYASAKAVLNVTSLLLPAGLTQRHFDVWAAGGLLLTDATPGLSIFPEELYQDIAFTRPEEIRPRFERLAGDVRRREVLVGAWRKYILAKHTYERRMAEVLEILDL